MPPLSRDDLAGVIAIAVKSATAPLLARIAVLEAKEWPKAVVGKQGEPGPAGKDAEVDLDALALKVAGLIPAPKDGRDGIDGATGPAGPLGEKGLDGVAGRDGQPGVPGVAGRDGVDGKDGAIGPMGEKGLDGKDGRDGTLDAIMPVLNERTMSFVFKADGSPVPDWSLKWPMLIDRGVYDSEKSYEVGDVLSYGGSSWICKADCQGKQPGTDAGGPFWRLAVKRGNDGKPGTKGMDGKDGKPGPPGRDGTRSY